MYLCVEKEVQRPPENKRVCGLLWLSHGSLNFFQEGKPEKNNSKGET